MTLKEELEILRGEPIEVFDGDPMDIPCIETSDAENLCKNPVVSVHMITYNHEPYIRQAIEGVMMQKTDFEFELVIGEDCSQDKTREICFEYQKKYPDKIRVLWWHKNVSKLGGNERRVTAHCRGEFIAFCEGDDYWIDPLKLQRQVDVMRKEPKIGLCLTGAKIISGADEIRLWNQCADLPHGLTKGRRFISIYLFGAREIYRRPNADSRLVITASALIRKTYLDLARTRYDVFRWKLRLGDVQMWIALASVSDVYILQDVTAVYNINLSSISTRTPSPLIVDGFLVRAYFMIAFCSRDMREMPEYYREQLYLHLICARIGTMPYTRRFKYLVCTAKSTVARAVIYNLNMSWLTIALWCGIGGNLLQRFAYGILHRLKREYQHPEWLIEMGNRP